MIALAAAVFAAIVIGAAAMFFLDVRDVREEGVDVATARLDAGDMASTIDAGALATATGTLHVEATPPANVLVDDVPKGRTPFSARLAPGAYVVKVVGPPGSGVVREHSVDVVAGETVNIVEAMPAARTVTPSTLRALAKRKAADLAPCGPRLEATALMTAMPDGKVRVVVDGPRAACAMARTVRWRVDPFEGEPVTARVDVVLGE